ncbi:MAG: outer membrane lipoprotein carrier protein LolA [Bacteroides sp.]
MKRNYLLNKRYQLSLFLWLWGVVAFPSTAFSQEVTPLQLLQRVEAKLRQLPAAEVHFSLRDASGHRYPGILCLQGDCFRLTTDGVITWFDGKTQATYLESSQEVNLSEPTMEELQSIHPYAWLSLYQQHYRLKFREGSEGGSAYTVVLTATSSKQDLLCLMLFINKSTEQLERMSLAYRGGETVVITIQQFKELPQPWPASMFTFDASAYPEVEVVDLR